MKFSILSDLLSDYLSTVNKVVGSNKNRPMETYVLMEFEGQELKLTGTDGEARLRTTLDIDKIEGGDISFCVRPQQLLDPLREISNQQLTFDVNEESYTMECRYNNGLFSFPVTSAENYPEAEGLGELKSTFQMPVGKFLKGIENAVIATATEGLRPLMTGVHIDIRPEHITFVATDGYMMSYYRNTALTKEVEMPFKLTIQKRSAQVLKNILSQYGDSEPIVLEVYPNLMRLSTPAMEMQSRMLEGNYPNYESVIPNDNTRILEVDRLLLLSAYKRVSIFANDTLNLVTLHINKDSIKLVARDEDFSKAGEEVIPASFSEDEELTISFNAEHMIGVLSTITEDMVRMRLGDRTRPALVNPINDNEDEEVLSAVMPLIY